MPGFTEPLPTPFDLQDAALHNEYHSAIRERGGLVITFPVVAAGDDIQGVTYWTDMQGWIEAACGNFVATYDYDSVLETYGVVSDWHGKENIKFWSWLTNDATHVSMKGALFGGNGWRRYTTHPHDGGGVLYGNCAAGDIIQGPWLLDDIRTALKEMVWQDLAIFAIADSTAVGEGDDIGGSSGIQIGTPWGVAVAAAEGAYALSGPGPGGDVTPEARTYGAGTPVMYNAEEAISSGWGLIANRGWYLGTGGKVAVDWYLKAVAPAWGDVNEWDDYGLGVIQDMWAKVLADDPSTHSVVLLGFTYILSSTLLTAVYVDGSWPTDEGVWATPEPTAGGGVRGWTTDASAAIARYDIAGGYEYY